MSVTIGLGNHSKRTDLYTLRLRYRRVGVNFIWDIEYLGEKLRCSKSSFSTNDQRFKENVVDYDKKNIYIQTLCNEIPKIIKDFLMEGVEPTKKNILTRFYENLGQNHDNDRKPTNVAEYINLFLVRAENGEVKNKKGKNLTIGSMRIYKRLYKYFYEVFPHITFNTITTEWIKSKFYPFLENEQRIDTKFGVFTKRVLQPDTIQGILTRLSRILRLAFEDGYSSNRIYETSSFQSLIPQITMREKNKDGKTNYALSDKQINELYLYETDKNNEVIVRDLFLLMCFSSLRVSDAVRLERNEIINDGEDFIIRKPTKKTGEYVECIIIEDIPKNIIKKFLVNGFPRLNEGYFNIILKQIAKKLNWDEVIVSNRIKGGVNVRTTQKLYEVISSHFARRTCITNLLRKGLNSYEIQGISGHQSLEMINLYDKRKIEERRETIKNKLRRV